MVVRLSWLSGRALAAQARGVLGLTPGDCQPFHFPPHNISKFIFSSVRQDALSSVYLTSFRMMRSPSPYLFVMYNTHHTYFLIYKSCLVRDEQQLVQQKDSGKYMVKRDKQKFYTKICLIFANPCFLFKCFYIS